jgi:PAS domain S-box-containing protein
MSGPTYQELQRKVKALEEIANLKVYPQELQFETIDLLDFRISSDWHVDFLDRKIIDLTRYDQEDFLDRKISWMDLVHPDDRKPVRKALQRALKSDKYFTSEHRILNGQGGTRWVKMRGRLFTDDQGGFLSIQGVLNGITT